MTKHVAGTKACWQCALPSVHTFWPKRVIIQLRSVQIFYVWLWGDWQSGHTSLAVLYFVSKVLGSAKWGTLRSWKRNIGAETFLYDNSRIFRIWSCSISQRFIIMLSWTAGIFLLCVIERMVPAGTSNYRLSVGRVWMAYQSVLRPCVWFHCHLIYSL